jgi:hypothetical protein
MRSRRQATRVIPLSISSDPGTMSSKPPTSSMSIRKPRVLHLTATQTAILLSQKRRKTKRRNPLRRKKKRRRMRKVKHRQVKSEKQTSRPMRMLRRPARKRQRRRRRVMMLRRLRRAMEMLCLALHQPRRMETRRRRVDQRVMGQRRRKRSLLLDRRRGRRGARVRLIKWTVLLGGGSGKLSVLGFWWGLGKVGTWTDHSYG